MVDESNDVQMRDQQGGNAQGCCGGGDDHDSRGASGGGGCCGGGGKSWKTVVFLLVLVLAGVVAAHSVWKRGEAGPVGEPLLSLADGIASQSPGLAGADDLAGNEPLAAAGVKCGITLKSIEAVFTIANEQKADTVLVFLAGANEEAAGAAAETVEATAEKLVSSGKAIGVFTLAEGASGYEDLMKALGIKTLPAAVVMSRGKGSMAVSGEMTEAKLLGAYVKSLSAAGCGTSCAPGSCAP